MPSLDDVCECRHDHWSRVELAVLEELNELANLIVDKAASSEVGTASTDRSFIWHRVVPKIDGLEESLGAVSLEAASWKR